MKKMFVLTCLLLTACVSSVSTTPVSYFNSSTPLNTESPNLKVDSSSEQSQPVVPSNIPPAVVLTQIGATTVVAESSRVFEKETGELYFFLQPRKAGPSIQLARVSSVCIFDESKCPPIEIIPVPFAFNFTINPLSWSPDGKFAAFVYSDNANGTPSKLWLFDSRTRNWTSIAQYPYLDPPFWSQDGTWIAFRTQDGTGGEAVFVIHPDGSGLKSISANLPAAGRPYIMEGWYTDGSASYVIMRSALPGKDGSVYLLSPSDGTTHPMIAAQLTRAQFIASPDSSQLAFDEYDQSTQNHTLKVMKSNGTNAVTLANFTGGSLYPIVWSPDSKSIAFNYSKGFANNEPSAEVFIVGRDGSNSTLVYKGVTVGRLIFSPNGKYLLVEETTSSTGGHLFLIDLATLEQKILQAPGLSTDYDWYAPSWSP